MIPFAVDPVVTNPCNGEGVSVDGQTIITLTTQTAASGNMHVTMETVTKGKGVGLATGTDYVIDSRDFTESEVAPAQEMTQVHKQVYVSQSGDLPNWVAHETVHMTMSASGVPSASTKKGHAECKG